MRLYNTANQLLGTVYYAGVLPTPEVPGAYTETLTYISTSANISLVEFSKEDYAPYRGAIFDNLRFGSLQTGPVFRVNTNDDHDDGSATEVDCTLREAINAANASGAVASTITFEPWVTGIITLQLGELAINQSMAIAGPGAKVLAVSGNGSSRVFKVTAGTVGISGLKIVNGRVIGLTGTPGVIPGGVGGTGGEAVGAGICNQGQLTLVDCWITENAAIGGTGGLGGFTNATFILAGKGGVGGTAKGAGIYSSNGLALSGCTVSGNTAGGGSGGKGGNGLSFNFFDGAQGGAGGTGTGGGVFSAGIVFNLTNCTISGNTATGGTGGEGGEDRGNGGAGGVGTAGGIAATGLNAAGCTITENSAISGVGGPVEGVMGARGPAGSAIGGGVANSNFNSIFNSLIARNSSPVSPDYAGDLTSYGYNLVGIRDQAGNFTNTGDQAGSSGSPLHPVLAPLANYGGETPTHPPLAGSPAIDKGRSGVFAPTLTTDQRGRPRPFDIPEIDKPSGGDHTDVGAVEVDYLAVPIPGLFNTGVNELGQPKSDDDLESHYLIARHPFPSLVPFVATSAGGFPIPPWLGDNAVSAWISQTVSTDQPPTIGYDKVYEIQFDLTGLDYTRAQISGRWAADNSGIISINGANTGLAAVGFDGFTPFKITTFFSPGINTLQFKVFNGGTSPNPSGVRVELSGIARLDLRASVTHSGGVATITWVSQPGRTYRVQCKAQPTDPVWNDLPGDVVATSGISSKTHFVGNAAQGFYQVILLP